MRVLQPMADGTYVVTSPEPATEVIDHPKQSGHTRQHPRWCDNVGIGCWMSGVVGLDSDVADGRHHTDVDGADTLAAQCAAHRQPWPDTLAIGTPSGGRHL